MNTQGLTLEHPNQFLLGSAQKIDKIPQTLKDVDLREISEGQVAALCLSTTRQMLILNELCLPESRSTIYPL